VNDDPLLKVSQVAERLQIHPATVRAWLKNGRLKGVYMGSDKVGWRILESELQRVGQEGFAADTEGE
jgi:excisionase family DNA binding protein